MTESILLVTDDAALSIVMHDCSAVCLTVVSAPSLTCDDIVAFDAVFVDARRDRERGMALLRNALEAGRERPVVMIVESSDVSFAVNAMRLGAYEIVERVDQERLQRSSARALENSRLVRENRELRKLRQETASDTQILGPSRQAESLRASIRELSAADVNVLVFGECGTGKGLVAKCLHSCSRRANAHFVSIDCSAIDVASAESELFGQEAFANSQRPKAGRVEHSNCGTLFLDEVERMPLIVQAKMLRVLEEHTVQRLGSSDKIDLDFRAIAASQVDLKQLQSVGGFRSDLYFRLGVVELYLPPLRDRRDDIIPLFEHFVREAEASYGRLAQPVSIVQSNRLLKHDWPGNIRELRIAAHRFVLGDHRDPPVSAVRLDQSLSEQVEAFERDIIDRSLEECSGRIDLVLRKLGLPRRTLSDKMMRLKLDRTDYLHGASSKRSA